MFSVPTLLTIGAICFLLFALVVAVVVAALFAGGQAPEEKSFSDNAEALSRDFDRTGIRALSDMFRSLARGEYVALRKQAIDLLSDLRSADYLVEALLLPLLRAHSSRLLSNEEHRVQVARAFRTAGYELTYTGRDEIALASERRTVTRVDDAAQPPAK